MWVVPKKINLILSLKWFPPVIQEKNFPLDGNTQTVINNYSAFFRLSNKVVFSMASFLQGDNKVVFFIASFKGYKLEFIICRMYISSL